MKIDRLLSIIMILLEKKKVSAPELAREFEVSVRTIYRDIETINQAGVPIVTYAGTNGGIGILDSYKADKRLFTPKDVTMLLMALGSVRTSFSSGEVAGAIAKIKGLVPEYDRKAIEMRADQISIDLTPWSGNVASVKTLEAIQLALRENLLLHFAYQDRNRQSSIRCIEPYRLILKRANWYIGGYCLDRQAIRLFKISRMSNIAVGRERFVPRSIDMDSFVNPDFDDGTCVPSVLRVLAAGRETIMELFGDDALTQETETSWIARIPLSDNEQGYSFVAGLGQGCEVLAPVSFREKMRKYFEEALKAYS